MLRYILAEAECSCNFIQASQLQQPTTTIL